MKYNVIHSEDPYLLARMSTDLQMEGVKVDLEWCERMEFHPFGYYFDGYKNKWLKLDNSVIEFHCHPCSLKAIHHKLTEENYIEVLTEILNQP